MGPGQWQSRVANTITGPAWGTARLAAACARALRDDRSLPGTLGTGMPQEEGRAVQRPDYPSCTFTTCQALFLVL